MENETSSHPFYVPAKRDFIPVSDLKPGDLLQSLSDGDSEDTSSEVESLELYLPEGKTYNLTVDVGHTFYVGELKTWVHNTGPCDLPPDYFKDGPKGAGDWAKLSGQLTEASKGKGNFGIGSGTREQADVMGKAWVGDGYKVASDGKTLVSQDDMRQYRLPTYKPNRQETQANFEQRFPGQKTKGWQSNAHLDITD